METAGSYIDVLVNKEVFLPAFVDSGCLCLATISGRAADLVGARRVPIKPRRLEQVVEEQNRGQAPQITEIAAFEADFDGNKEDLWAYVIQDQHEQLIIGKRWLTDHDATVRPATEEVEIRRPWQANLRTRKVSEAKEISPHAVRAYRARMQRSAARDQPESLASQGSANQPTQTQIFSASLQDLEKALATKKHRDPRAECPSWLQPVVDAFDRQKAKELPPHRPGLDHEINLEGGKSAPAMPLYSMSRDELLVLRKTLYELLDQGFIRASSSPAGAPVIFVKKPGGGLRFCVDYRGLNAVTKKDRYPLPRIEETLRDISQARWVSSVDVISAFHRLRIRQGDEEKTAFRTRLGSFEWLVTPFGLCGAPASFQRYINSILQPWLGLTCSAYLDDVVIYTDGSQEHHREQVRQIVQALGEAGLQLDWEKSQFEARSIKYLGFIVEPGIGLRADLEKIKTILDWERPQNVRAVRAFLGFGNFYRQFISNYSRIAGPLTALTRKDQQFRWGQDEQQAFDQLKQAFVNTPLLATYRPGRRTVVEADCSGWALGGVLRQQGEADQLLHPVAYYSRKLTPAEVNYPIHDKEMLATYSCIKQWSAMLRGQAFEVWSDHKNLVYFQTKQTLAERQRRWAYELSEYDFRILHKAGKTQIQSDALSRRDQDMPRDADDDRIRSRDLQMLHGSRETGLTIAARAELTKAAPAWLVNADDGDDQPTESDLQGDQPRSPFEDAEMTQLWIEALAQNGRYWRARQAVQEGARSFPKAWGLAWQISECRIDEGGRLRWRDRIWVPHHEPLRTQIIQRVHDSPLAGHPGREITRDLVAREYAWPKLTEDVRRFVANCDICGKSKIWREQKRGLLKPLPVPGRAWQELAMDFVGELPESGSGDAAKYILGVTDRLTKSMILIPMAEIGAAEVAEALLRHVFSHHGLPKAIVSDRGPQFVSLFWGTICRMLGIRRRLSTAFHPETDGAQERSNQEIETYLRAFVSYQQDDWASLLPVAQLALNNRTTTTTGISPFFLTHGFHQDILGSVADESLGPVVEELGSNQSPATRGQLWVEKQKDALAFAQAAMAAAQETQERHANRGRQAAEAFRIGDRVWLKLKNVKTTRPSKKLDWLALPYRVIGLVGSHAVRLDTPPGIHPVFSVNLVRRARTDPLPSQQRQENEPPEIQPTEVTDDLAEGEWRVEQLLQHRRRGRGWQVLVKWTGWSNTTWEPLAHVQETAALEDYEQHLRDTSGNVPWLQEAAGPAANEASRDSTGQDSNPNPETQNPNQANLSSRNPDPESGLCTPHNRSNSQSNVQPN